jgi:hypothetical protein
MTFCSSVNARALGVQLRKEVREKNKLMRRVIHNAGFFIESN